MAEKTASPKQNAKDVLTAIGLLFMTVSCATSENFSKRPLRSIDRDFTQPAGVTSWKVLFGVAIDSEPSPFVYPVQWEQGVTDSFTLIWMPLPLEVAFRLIKTQRFTLSIGGAFLGQIQTRNRNFDWRPTSQVLARWKTWDSLAFDFEALNLMEVTRDGVGSPAWLGMYRVAPWWQVVDRLGLSVGAAAQLELGTIRSRYVGQLPVNNVGILSEQGLRWRVPITFALEWSPWDQWQIRADGWIYGVAGSEAFTSASCFLTLSHTW